MVCNGTSERGNSGVPKTKLPKKAVLADMQAFYGAFSQRLGAARQKGELAEDFNVEVAAQVIVTYLQGLFRVIRVLQGRAEVERQIEALLTGLGL